VENEQESVTETRVRLYRKALAQQREINELAERETEQAKEAEADPAKEPKEPESDSLTPTRTSTATRAEFLGRERRGGELD